MKYFALLCMFAALVATCPCTGQTVPQDTATVQHKNDNLMKYAGKVNAPDFPANLEWLNTGRPLSIRDLRGKVVLLDFWTYCCINCMHIIPDLKKLEEKYADELVVIGVHSAKFATEKGTDNIREAVLRYEVDHPVVNDKDFRVWSEYGARAWPTLILVDPLGKVIGSLSGEGIYEPLDKVIAEVVHDFDAAGILDRTPLKLTPEKDIRPPTLLSYPGKVIADERDGRLFFTDSNHNRIVISTLDGEILEVIGSGEAGTQDGDFSHAQFFHPQGLALDADGTVLYIADTENHLIRRADLKQRTVETIAGTGQQARQYNVEGRGTSVALNSPWDILLIGDTLYIAMAGPHQLWTLDVRTLDAAVYAGTGREDIIDGPLKSSALAQPSGITTDGTTLYFADSEVSAIRSADLDSGGRVETLIGEGLFEFGDVDGSYPTARLQHPLGVVWHDGSVYVADTYNHKIKRVDPVRKTVKTVLGTGQKGHRDGDASTAQLFEPSGLVFARGLLYITDTNNDVLRVYNPETQKISTVQFTHVEKLKTVGIGQLRSQLVDLPEQRITPEVSTLELHLRLPEGTKFNADAPFSLVVHSQDTTVVSVPAVATTKPANTMSIPVQLNAGSTTLELDLSVYYCAKDNEGLCYFRDVTLRVPVVVTPEGNGKLTVDFEAGTMATGTAAQQ